MNPEPILNLQAWGTFPVLLTKEKVAVALGVATHNIPPLMRAGLLKPLGHPGRYCVKHFSRDDIAGKLTNPEWLDKVMAAIHRHCAETKSTEGVPMKTERAEAAAPNLSLIPAGERYLSKPEVAARLGMTARTIEHWMALGVIPYLKIGKGRRATVLFKWADIEAHLKTNYGMRQG